MNMESLDTTTYGYCAGCGHTWNYDEGETRLEWKGSTKNSVNMFCPKCESTDTGLIERNKEEAE